MNSHKYTCLFQEELRGRKPDLQGQRARVWTLRQNATTRINLVEMTGELAMHQHPDADHSLMVHEGRVRARIGDEYLEVAEGDFISVPETVPHQYWSLTPTSMLVSMDAPYCDPEKTVVLE